MIRSHGVGFTCEICGGNDFGTKQGLLKHKRDKHGMHIYKYFVPCDTLHISLGMII